MTSAAITKCIIIIVVVVFLYFTTRWRFLKIYLVDKCIRAQIVDPGSVARWIFSPEMGKYFNRFYIWEILHGTISKMNHHVHRVQDDYDNIVKRQQNSSVKMEEGM